MMMFKEEKDIDLNKKKNYIKPFTINFNANLSVNNNLN